MSDTVADAQVRQLMESRRTSDLAEERSRIQRAFIETGLPPEPSPLWPVLADERWIVLDESGCLRMAHPFSAVPTDFVVMAGARRWYANCAWDGLAVMTMVRAAVAEALVFHTHCGGSGEPMRFEIGSGGPAPSEARLHFAVPIRDWWRDIAFT